MYIEKNWMFNPEFLATDNNEGHEANALIQYLQDQPADVLQRVAKSASPEIQEIIRHNVQGLLGMLPGEQFEVKVTSSKDNLASLLASAMMTGYFLRQMEQRKQLEETLLSDEEMSVDVDPDKI
jgi:23S rRNA G2069 N7-methylase RlmK/C1962 C5-methylase RlmI